MNNSLISFLIKALQDYKSEDDIPKLKKDIWRILSSSDMKQVGDYNLFESIDFGFVKEHPVFAGAHFVGMKLKNEDIRLADIVNFFEDAPIPEEVKEKYHNITEMEWSSVLRFATLILTSLQRDIWISKSKNGDRTHFARIVLSTTQEYRNNSNLVLLTDIILKSLLDYGSETDDNLNAVMHLEFGVVEISSSKYQYVAGIKLKGRPILISDVFSTAESTDIPEEVLEAIPNLTEDEWRATLRFVSLLLVSLEQPL